MVVSWKLIAAGMFLWIHWKCMVFIQNRQLWPFIWEWL